ncbi:MAG: amino acid adenylation domain-containing protein, partial [Acidobacteriota bacterium]|nr:amino acid adenylation domain-containing protein [Acidobacteriota bacterium]
LPLLDEEEERQLVVRWNRTAVDWGPEGPVHELFEAQAARVPDSPALVSDSLAVSYGELNRRANRLAHHLRRLGVGPEARVGLCLERGAPLVTSVLAVWKAGGAYVPLDPAYPAARLRSMIADASPLVVIAAERHPGLALETPVLALGEVRELLASLPGDNPRPAATPGNAAYVIYTSGSTGLPKGAVIEHRNLFHLVHALGERWGWRRPHRMLQFSSPSFDASVAELAGVLPWGGALIVGALGQRLAGHELARLIGEQEVDAAILPPSLLAHLSPADFPGLTMLVTAGEACPGEVAARFAEGRRLWNGYGPTECTVCAATFPCGGEPLPPPIGRPVANTRLYVLDERMKPQPIGVPGELYIGGAGVSRGYLDRPDLTAFRFVPDVFGGSVGMGGVGAGGGRLYRTGDRVRLRRDGELEYLGRVDGQVKLRGFRIEPGEIEAVLRQSEGVREAAVVVREDLAGGRGLVAYVVGQEGAAVVAEALREGLLEKLPAYMVPVHVVPVTALALTANGKLDRRWLVEHGPLPEMSGGQGSWTPPRTPIEELLAGLFAEVLAVEGVGLEADFFALGGHSLLATQLISRLRATFQVELSLRTLFEQPTVAGLARAVEELQQAGAAVTTPPTRQAVRDELPLSYAQERLWFLQQLEPQSAAYNMPLEFELSGTLVTGALAAALTEVIRRHESLRTTFVLTAGTPHQRISPPAPAVALPLVDLSVLPEPAGRSVAEGLARQHASQGFDLARGPLSAWLLVRLTGERHRFLLNLHHTIADGWSMGVLARELGELYAAAVEERPSRLPELPIQYADFAHWQRKWLEERQEAELAYWESRLGGEVALAELPADRPRPALQSFRGGRRQLVLPADLTARLKRFGQKESVTLFMTLLAATQTLLSRHSGEHDVAVGAPVAGRQRVETEGLIGCFLNTLVLRTDTSGRPSFRTLAARVRTVTLEAYSHQEVPFEAVVARLGLRRDLSRAPLFQVLFNLLNLPAAELALPGLALRALMPAEVPSKLDLTFYASEADAAVGIDLVYNADLFDEARMAEVLAQLEALLRQAVEQPDEPVAHLSLVTAAARALLPDPASELGEPAFPAVARLFLEREQGQPEQAALCWREESWT